MFSLAVRISIGVREGSLLGRAEKICPETNFFSFVRMKPETSLVSLFYTVEFVYNGFVCNVNSPI